MDHTKDQPMPAQKYTDTMFWLGVAWKLGATFVGLAFLLVAVRTLMVGGVSANEIVLLVGVMLVCGPASLLVRHRARTVDHEWHLFRGNILEVNTSDIIPGHVLVLFDGDEAYTRFTVADYREHEGILQADKNLVLVVRRSLAFGAPTYEAAVYARR